MVPFVQAAQVKRRPLCLTPTGEGRVLRRASDAGELWIMTKQALMDEILRLSVEERIELLGDVWDWLAGDPEAIPVPEWHLRELERRLADPEPQYISWEELRERLAGETEG